MDNTITQEQAYEELKKGYSEAEDILQDEDKLELLFQKMEKKIKAIPKLGDKLSHVITFASMIRSYVKKEYELPLGTVISMVSALIYFVSPIDLIPDYIPVAGHLDDATVVGACLYLIDDDVKEYLKWREDNNKVLI